MRRSGFRSFALAALALLVALATALTVPQAVLAVGDQHEHAGKPLADVDARRGTVAPTAAQRDLAKRLATRVRWNAYGTPASLVRHGGYLATGLGADAPAAARAFLTANRELFGLTPEAITALELVNDAPVGRGRAVLLRQRFGTLRAGQDGMVAVGVVDGKIAYVSSSLTSDTRAPAEATLTVAEAYRRASADVGRELAADAIAPGGLRRGWFEFGVEGSAETQRARLVAMPTPTDGIRPAWETLIIDNDDGPFAMTHFVDARTGEVLFRQSRVNYATEEWEVFPANPPLDATDSTDTRQTWCWDAGQQGCDRILEGPGTPERTGEWDTDQPLAADGPAVPTQTTEGNAATTSENWENFRAQTRPGQRAVSPQRHYTSTGALATWTNAWSNQRCNPVTSFTPAANNNDILAATTNLFAMHNRMHDFSYELGFTERTYNLQKNNFGRGREQEGDFPGDLDPESGNAQAGAVAFGQPTFMGRDNANQTTLPDGLPGLTNMYLWQPIAGAFYPPCVDGDYDMSVIGHEYTHAISNRMVAGPDSNLGTREGGSMGESWSDLVAVEYLNEYGFVPTENENPFSVGSYVTGDGQAGIRNYGMNRSPLNYANVGYDLTGAQVHSDGEIWSATNFDIRQALVAKYDAAFPASDGDLQRRCADGELPADRCPGNRRWVQIVFDAFLLMQADVSMVDARDAYLAADMMRFGGANQRELWRAFAGRGLGEKAAEDPRNVASRPPADVTPKPSFESPLETDEAVLTFDPVGTPGARAPEEVELYLGDYEARTTPVADTDPRSTGVGTTLTLLPGTYDFIARADGFGAVKFRRTVTAGERAPLRVAMAENLASQSNGADITGDAGDADATAGERNASLRALIDDTEASTWASFANDEGENEGDPEQGDQEEPRTVEGRKVTVNLSGGRQLVDRVQVSSMLRTRDPNDTGGDNATQNRFSALRQFEILTCTASEANEGCTKDDGFRSIYTSPADAFPSVAPRPRVPELNLRSFDVPDTEATHVRMRVLTNQCTGAPDYQGDQDADPANNSDCSEGRPILIASQGDIVRAAGLQVFESRSTVAPPEHGAAPAPSASGPPEPATTTAASGQNAPAAKPRCTTTSGFRATSVRSAGRRALRFAFVPTRPRARADVDVFQVSRGRTVIGERLVARFADQPAGFRWNGRANRPGRKVTDGYYVVRFRTAESDGRGTDARRTALRRSRGRFSARPSFYDRTGCQLIRSFKLERPVFGGRSNRALHIAYQIGARATTEVRVLRGSRVVRRTQSTAAAPERRTLRVRFDSEGRPRGDYTVQLIVRQGRRTVTRTLTARRI